MRSLQRTLSLIALAFASVAHGAVKNVVLVHGAFADGSGWKAVADILQRDGYTVYVVQEPETTFEADVLATRIVLDRSGRADRRPQLRRHDHLRGPETPRRAQPTLCRSLTRSWRVRWRASEQDIAGSHSVAPAGAGFVQVKPDAFLQTSLLTSLAPFHSSWRFSSVIRGPHLRRQDHRCSLVGQAQLRGHRHRGSHDQPGP